ncbi:hypothetical protein, partial [Butyricimonas paravirosa]|uniref:hypothetical protein n=1 Tax=Butyricimonas paravirosa TaxID=1472417 RepID=UPI002A83F15C
CITKIINSEFTHFLKHYLSECYEQRLTATNTINGQTFSYEVIAFNDLINSKIKAGRPKDLYDIIELRKIQENKN